MKHSKYSVYLHSQVESQADIRCYINSASLFGNPMQRKQLQQQRRTISDTGQKKCLCSRHFAPVPPRPRYAGSSAAPAPSICYVGFPPIFPPFHSTSTVVEHYARYAATWWKQTTSLFSPPPLRVMRALSIFWRHYKHAREDLVWNGRQFMVMTFICSWNWPRIERGWQHTFKFQLLKLIINLHLNLVIIRLSGS